MLSINVTHLNYYYTNEETHFEHVQGLTDISFNLSKGDRLLVVGRNGAGKSTLLSILGGKKIISDPINAATVLGRPAFHDTSLGRDVMYLGEWWKNDLIMDVTVAESMADQVHSQRFQKLAKLLDVDLNWKISRISDGQRRRCQLLANLAEPNKSVYIMDEATTDLDLVARDSLMWLLKEETENHQATVVYATHIFDNIEGWPTHILYLSRGRVKVFLPIDKCQRYAALKAGGCLTPLYTLVRDWLYQELDNGDKQPNGTCPSNREREEYHPGEVR